MSRMRTIKGHEELRAAVGEELGTSDWQGIDQARIDAFADVTGDHQFIHVDPERAKETPFGGTIAHGYLTLSLVPVLMAQAVAFEGFNFGVNYGTNKVRFPAPVPVDSRVRATARLAEVTEIPNGSQAVVEVTIELEGGDKPVCVAETVVRYY